ncbi:hypothetical protein EAG_04872 [Camponotus floridanus]|uniref:Uncharacterized protein n=1 Tax=Camponotus floridanus TaxID=104421 RepID=E2ASK1_CAMFO|nr:hypothetical protein EAG_04872 [Camponotus floridanus]
MKRMTYIWIRFNRRIKRDRVNNDDERTFTASCAFCCRNMHDSLGASTYESTLQKEKILDFLETLVCLVHVRSFVISDNNVEHVLTHYGEILCARGRGEGRRVCRNFAAECTREGEVDFAERYLALVRVVRLKHTVRTRTTSALITHNSNKELIFLLNKSHLEYPINNSRKHGNTGLSIKIAFPMWIQPGYTTKHANAPRVVTVCQVVHSAVLKTQRDSGGLFLTLRVLRGCDAPLRKPPWPMCVKAYGNVRGMIKAPTVLTAITAVKGVVNETPSGAAVYVTVIR